MKLVKLTNEKTIAIQRRLEGMGATDVSVYNMDTGCTVIYNKENSKEHVSISHTKRLPRWDEVKFVRYQLMKPDATVAQILPPKSEYVNLHENCFHLWEINNE